MLRRLLLLGIALAGMAHAATPPHIELTATPAWAGWSRPGRVTEIDIRLATDAATRATLDLVAGRQTVRAELDLQPGRAVRLHVPVAAATTVVVSVGPAGGVSVPIEVGVAQSESPVLGVAMADAEPARVEGIAGFHTVALAADDLPRNASAYASIDALIIDAATLGALDERQLGALLAHAAGCGRIAVVNTDERVRRSLDGAAGCGGRALVTATSLAAARAGLAESLATSLPAAMSPGALGAVTGPGHAAWDRVAVALAVYFAAAVLLLMFSAALPVLVLAPALAAVAALVLLHATPPASQLVVWSEGESGAAVARYQALQQFPGSARERVRVPLPPLLASAARPCDVAQALRLDLDTRLGQAGFAEFDSRLFGQTALCYAGSFPIARALTTEAGADGSREVANAGGKAWPPGRLLVAGRVHDLPGLGPGERLSLAAQAGTPPRDAVARTAMARTPPGSVVAVWPLDLAGVAVLPAGATGWLLVSEAAPRVAPRAAP